MEPVNWLAEGRGFVLGKRDLPGGRHRRRTEKHCGCKGRRLLVLDKVSHEWYAAKWQEMFTSLEAGDWSGYFYTSGEKVREGRKGKEEDEP